MLTLCALCACAADPDPEPDRLDASGAGGAKVGDAIIDAFVPEPDMEPRPGCVAPIDGQCPDDIVAVHEGATWDADDGCWRTEIISCLYDTGAAFGEATFCREADNVPFWVPEIGCVPFPARQCTAAELDTTAAVGCPDG